MRYSLKVIDEPEFFPGSTGTPSVMKIRIAPSFTEDGMLDCYNENDGFAAILGGLALDKTTLMSKGPFNDTWPGTSTYTPFAGGTALDGTTLPASSTLLEKDSFSDVEGTYTSPALSSQYHKKLHLRTFQHPWLLITITGTTPMAMLPTTLMGQTSRKE